VTEAAGTNDAGRLEAEQKRLVEALRTVSTKLERGQ
jgi:hypothetical protein